MSHSDDFLFSVNSYLAYMINQNYYSGVHYVWCATKYNDSGAPASANPCDIMRNYHRDVQTNDEHSLIISQNKLGILKGVDAKYEGNAISSDQRDELINIVSSAQLSLFRPILYIIVRERVLKRMEWVPLKRRASSFSRECIISNLATSEFDIIDSKDVMI